MTEPARDAMLLKGTLDICVLALVESGDAHGYGLARALKDGGMPLVNERTVYPLLRRLENEGLLGGYLVASTEGPARKYYRNTPKGRAALRERARRTFEVYDAARRIVGPAAGTGGRGLGR